VSFFGELLAEAFASFFGVVGALLGYNYEKRGALASRVAKMRKRLGFESGL
jgi:hypothetical protein